MALMAITILMALAAWHLEPGWNWFAVIVLMLGFMIVLGKALVGRGLGILINQRNLMSLSRFQMTVWTVVILSAYFVMAIMRTKVTGVEQPLVIQIDWQIWALLGISTASLVGTPLINTNKKNKVPANLETTKAAQVLKEDEKTIDANREGILYANDDVSQAHFTDMFEGDEIKNTNLIDVSKLQMFFFTIIVATVFCAEVFRMILTQDVLAADVSLPLLPEGLLTLMGISNAGYLGSKAVDHTPST